MDPREAKLPAWARELIAELRRRVQLVNDPLVAEMARLRPQVDLLRRRNSALVELMECAARGEHKTAQQIVEIVLSHDLVIKDDDK